MTKLEDIEKAVARLGRSELARFRVWFETSSCVRVVVMAGLVPAIYDLL
jgi:hypothetical protein